MNTIRRRSSPVTALVGLAIATTIADAVTLVLALGRPGFVELHPVAVALLAGGGLPLALAARGILAIVWLAAARILVTPAAHRPHRPRAAVTILAIAAAAGLVGAWSNVA